MTPATSTATLTDLFIGLFSEHELRAFVAHRLPGGERIATLLPGAGCPLAHLADQTAQTLVRHGLVGRDLFDALLAARPARRIDIERVATTCGFPVPATIPSTALAGPTASPSPASPTAPAGSPAPASTSTATTDPNTWDVFISYARADLTWVNTLAENLHELGLRVFFDEWEIGAGDVVVHRLDKGLLESRNGILIVSPTSMTRPWVLEEYAVLLTRAVAKNLRLIPVLHADADMPPMLATRAWVDLRGKTGDEYLDTVVRLARVLKGERPGPPPVRGTLRTP